MAFAGSGCVRTESPRPTETGRNLRPRSAPAQQVIKKDRTPSCVLPGSDFSPPSPALETVPPERSSEPATATTTRHQGRGNERKKKLQLRRPERQYPEITAAQAQPQPLVQVQPDQEHALSLPGQLTVSPRPAESRETRGNRETREARPAPPARGEEWAPRGELGPERMRTSSTALVICANYTPLFPLPAPRAICVKLLFEGSSGHKAACTKDVISHVLGREIHKVTEITKADAFPHPANRVSAI